jgi:palmitoyltransferase
MLRRFLLFLVTQTATIAWALDAALSCLRNVTVARESSFFGFDWRVLATVVLLVILLGFIGCLLGTQLYLVATAQTTREYSQSAKVVYLAHVPADLHPFSKGMSQNVLTFLVSGSEQRWELPTITEMAFRSSTHNHNEINNSCSCC